MKDYQFCATCIHFEAKKHHDGMVYTCTRLGYQTHPKYKFNCWTPKDHVKKLMEKENKTGDL